MARLSIALPDNTQITLETDEAELLENVVAMVLRNMSRDSTRSARNAPAPSTNGTAKNGTGKNGTGAGADLSQPGGAAPKAPEQPVREQSVPEQSVSKAPHNPEAEDPPSVPSGPRRAPAARHADPAAARAGSLRLDEQNAQSRGDFVSFCQHVNPMGDMRRVVVAAEGASRFFESAGVDAADLDSLFDLAGWRRPINFTQTLRNAARVKFGWLERIPGRYGRYAVTTLGRSVAVDG